MDIPQHGYERRAEDHQQRAQLATCVIRQLIQTNDQPQCRSNGGINDDALPSTAYLRRELAVLALLVQVSEDSFDIAGSKIAAHIIHKIQRSEGLPTHVSWRHRRGLMV